MKTKLHYYYFNLTEPDQAAAWKVLREQLRTAGYGPRRFHAHGGTEAEAKNETIDVDIETACIFENQWNTAPPHNQRVFDWFQQYEINRTQCARGHWLEITPEMQAAREKTLKCGYCGKHYGPHHGPLPDNGFCSACLDSPYLKETELHLLRLLPLLGDQKRRHLSKEEKAVLQPRYVERQTTGNDSRAVQKREKQRVRILDDFADVTANATTERDGKMWLWEKGMDIDNVIFYDHTGRFGFGWRSPVSATVKSKLLDILVEFPFEYDIKSE